MILHIDNVIKLFLLKFTIFIFSYIFIYLLISKSNIIPVFFHGSGGSVDRGGGGLKEQTAWWPKSALKIYKSEV